MAKTDKEINSAFAVAFALKVFDSPEEPNGKMWFWCQKTSREQNSKLWAYVYTKLSFTKPYSRHIYPRTPRATSSG